MQSIRIMEVGPRDGLQNESTIIDTASKVAFIESLVDAGAKRIEVTAFVNPRWIPALADHLEVALQVKKRPGVSYAALVPNMKGYERTANTCVTEVSIVLAATETHNKKNLNASTEEAFSRYVEVAAAANKDKVPFRAYISCAFGCPFEGEVPEERVLDLALRLLDLGAYEIALGDTIGIAKPVQTRKLLERILKRVDVDRVGLHMHDTRGLALTNIFVAQEMGIRSFDAAAGGAGGCPYAPGASGNVSTEDLLNLLDGLGFASGISLDKVVEVSHRLEKLLGRELPSKMLSMRRLTVSKSQ
jgi:hydroxymethylglutaryl-CoA lyase